MALLTRRPSRVARGTPALLAACLLASCGGGGPTTGPAAPCTSTPPRGSMTASVNGSPFTADLSTQGTVRNSSAQGPNIVQVNGVGCVDGTATRARQVLITIGRLTPITPGTYRLEAAAQGQPAGSGYSGIASFVSAPNLWYSNIGTGSGSVTFTTVSATRLAGTFSLVVAPADGNTSGNQATLTITNGAFDIPLP